jgi:serine/threonine protein kinase
MTTNQAESSGGHEPEAGTVLWVRTPGATIPGAPLPEEYQSLALPGYEFLSLLGRGGMGLVFLARQRELNRFVAVKMLSPSVHCSLEGLRRLQAEALTLATLNHPNIVSCHDMIRDGDRLFVVMDYVPGQLTVWDLSVRYGPLLEQPAAQIILQAARGLAYCQDKGIVHRDIKPNNLLVFCDREEVPATLHDLLDGEQPRIMIADFGLAKCTTASEPQATPANLVVGTPAYMAPEQAEGHAVDCRADIYALGATLFRLLTGHDPFEAETDYEALRLRLTTEFPDVSTWGMRISAGGREVLSKMTARDPAERYQDYRELLQDLEAWAANPASHRARRGRRSWWWRAGIALVALDVFLGVAAWFLIASKSRDQDLSQSLEFWSQAESHWTVAPADDAVETEVALVCTAPGGRLTLRRPLPADADFACRMRLPGPGQLEILLLDGKMPVWQLHWTRTLDGSRLQAGLVSHLADLPASLEIEPEEWRTVRVSVNTQQVVLYVDSQLASYAQLDRFPVTLTPVFELSDGRVGQVKDIHVTPREQP